MTAAVAAFSVACLMAAVIASLWIADRPAVGVGALVVVAVGVWTALAMLGGR